MGSNEMKMSRNRDLSSVPKLDLFKQVIKAYSGARK